LDRTAPILPMRPGLPEKATHDYIRHGTTSLFAALEVATGKVTDACYQRHTHAEFLDFLKLVAKQYRGSSCTSSPTTTPRTSTPGSTAGWPQPADQHALHPTSGSWLNLVEVFFGIITRQAIDAELHQRQGTHRRHRDVHRRLERTLPAFVWTKTADEILTKANRKKTSNTRH